MAARIHLFGASGCGATTLGAALGQRLGVPHLEADDYYWLPTDPPFTDKYPRRNVGAASANGCKGTTIGCSAEVRSTTGARA
ncbi:hypothetical protein WJ971_17465 [Achromobacter xylosoxidans]